MARHKRIPHAPWGWALAGSLLGLLGALLVFAPASWAAAALTRASEGRVQLLEPRGTLWNGSARVRLTGGAGSRDAMSLPSRLHWTLRPSAGASAAGGPGLSLQVRADCCTPAPLGISLGWHPGGAEVVVADAPASQWPAGLLAGLGTPWNTLDLDGRLQLQTQGLRLRWEAGRLQVAGRAELSLLEASSRLATLRPLGSYRMLLEGGAVPGLRLDTLEGALQLQGSGQWVGERLRFSGEASAQPGREAVLDNLLNIIGRRAGARALITLG